MITKPTQTANCIILHGYIGGRLQTPYRMVEFNAVTGQQIIEHDNGNRYSVEIRQILGTE